ncbi:hypothetical protein LCGC14_2679440 [marine sediment metagenome]|uniref:Uncharacterized protein n=1 Tax=marine sediment metagenome TaxID=412755 RepID=A0A0F9BWG4_9ZZZZ
MSPRKFFLVWVNDTPTTRMRHPSYNAACEEANRLARLNSGKKVYVLEAIDYRWVEEAPLTYKAL